MWGKHPCLPEKEVVGRRLAVVGKRSAFISACALLRNSTFLVRYSLFFYPASAICFLLFVIHKKPSLSLRLCLAEVSKKLICETEPRLDLSQNPR